MFFVFGKCPFLLRWKNVLSGMIAHAHFRALPFLSALPEITGHRFSCVASPFLIDRLLSGTHPVIVRFSRYMSGARTVIA